MKTYYHILIGLTIGITVIFLTRQELNFPAMLPWILGSCFPDLDHPFRYCLNHKTIRIRKVLRLILEDYKINHQNFYPFHTIEFVIFSAIFLRKFNYYSFWITAYLLHLFLDIYRQYRFKRGYGWLKKWSIILALRNRNK